MLKSNLCNYNDSYTLEKGDVKITGNKAAPAAFKDCAPFTKCITEIDETVVDVVEHLDMAIPMYNLFENSSNYLKFYINQEQFVLQKDNLTRQNYVPRTS